jgi:hypothetical protein
MMAELKKRRGQFSIIAAFIVVVVLVSATIQSFNLIQSNQFTEPVMLLSTTQTLNEGISRLLTYSTSYYCSITSVTGDDEYANEATGAYLTSGLVQLSRTESRLNPSFEVMDMRFTSLWYEKVSSTTGTLTIKYDVNNIGLKGVVFKETTSLIVDTLQKIVDGSVQIITVNVQTNGKPDVSLTKENFLIIVYDVTSKSNVFISLDKDPLLIDDGTYLVSFTLQGDPSELNLDTLTLQVTNNLGVVVNGIYIRDVNQPPGGGQGGGHYKFNINWDTHYDTDLTHDSFVIEYLQGGDIRFLGKTIPTGMSIPRVSVSKIRVTTTVVIDGVPIQIPVPFQVEDWAFSYQIPLGLSNQKKIFQDGMIIAMLIDHTIDDVTISWDTTDALIPSSSFNDDPANHLLQSKFGNNTFKLDFSGWSSDKNKPDIKASFNSVPAIEASFGHTETDPESDTLPTYPGPPTFIIVNGTVRDIVINYGYVEPDDPPYVPSIYYNYVITLPAKASYYTYQITNTLTDTSPPLTRDINRLSILELTLPNAFKTDKYYMAGIDGSGFTLWSSNFSIPIKLSSCQWIEYQEEWSGNTGVGILMMSNSSEALVNAYISPLGPSGVIWKPTDWKLDLSPIYSPPLTDTGAYPQKTFHGAVVLFDSARNMICDTAHPDNGLWTMVVYPPIFTRTS